ncbi:DUF2922 domain-containing protein [Alkalihalobacillus oceani]|uniref:DUF2922 domain-containing protein n=1 Tax=Halalkalibacter oceani TaxID=1653776 RepID=UPI0020420E1C|nr:DUF2922 domain-containing protein [Halalkalibacter oceani]MCM3762420.1 DUF2922 domain-containing protein [Halalkalibacter oceani]
MGEQTLELRFRNDLGRTIAIRVLNPREDVTAEEISGVMDVLMENNVFAGAVQALEAKIDARIVSRAVETIIV